MRLDPLRAGVAYILLIPGCGGEPVGAPCIPEDEYRRNFGGFSVEQVNIESRSFQCESRVCLVNHFQGRVSCPYGTPADPNSTDEPRPDPKYEEPCRIPATDGATDAERVSVPVMPQLVARPTEDAVYCSCRCAGDDPNARYCDCPDGFTCTKLVDDFGFGNAELAGSYCVKEGTHVPDFDRLEGGLECDPEITSCGPPHPG